MIVWGNFPGTERGDSAAQPAEPNKVLRLHCSYLDHYNTILEAQLELCHPWPWADAPEADMEGTDFNGQHIWKSKHGAQLRAALETFFKTLGCELLTAQIQVQERELLERPEEFRRAVPRRRQHGHLALAAVNGETLSPEEPKVLPAQISAADAAVSQEVEEALADLLEAAKSISRTHGVRTPHIQAAANGTDNLMLLDSRDHYPSTLSALTAAHMHIHTQSRLILEHVRARFNQPGGQP